MRSMIFGLVGVAWGGAIVVYGLASGLGDSRSYAAGQVAALVLGALMLVVGARTLIRR